TPTSNGTAITDSGSKLATLLGCRVGIPIPATSSATDGAQCCMCSAVETASSSLPTRTATFIGTATKGTARVTSADLSAGTPIPATRSEMGGRASDASLCGLVLDARQAGWRSLPSLRTEICFGTPTAAMASTTLRDLSAGIPTPATLSEMDGT